MMFCSVGERGGKLKPGNCFWKKNSSCKKLLTSGYLRTSTLDTFPSKAPNQQWEFWVRSASLLPGPRSRPPTEWAAQGREHQPWLLASAQSRNSPVLSFIMNSPEPADTVCALTQEDIKKTGRNIPALNKWWGWETVPAADFWVTYPHLYSAPHHLIRKFRKWKCYSDSELPTALCCLLQHCYLYGNSINLSCLHGKNCPCECLRKPWSLFVSKKTCSTAVKTAPDKSLAGAGCVCGGVLPGNLQKCGWQGEQSRVEYANNWGRQTQKCKVAT